MTEKQAFGFWSADNKIVCGWRSRFDGMREGLRALAARGELTQETFRALLVREGYAERYPVIPEEMGVRRK